MALHSNLQSFMGELKALPKGSPARGQLITANMSHPPFISALQNHPEGKQMHAQLTGFLNSRTNAGPGNAAKVTVKSEPADAILKTEGDSSVADEKTYTVEEAKRILQEDFQAKLVKYSAEIENLMKRETNKSVIPTHDHDTGAAASSGTEDIAAGQANPKGTAKDEMEKGESSSSGSLKWQEMSRHGANSRKRKLPGSRAQTIHHSAYATHTPKEAKKRYENHPSVGEYIVGAHKPHSVNFHHTQVETGPKHLGNHDTLEGAKAAAEKHHDSMKTEKGETDSEVVKSDLEKCGSCGNTHGKMEKCGEVSMGKAFRDTSKPAEHQPDSAPESKPKNVCETHQWDGGEFPCPDCKKVKKNGEMGTGSSISAMVKPGMAKSNLVDAKGDQSRNDVDPDAVKDPNDHPTEPDKRADASGGKITKSGGPAAMAKRAMKMNKSDPHADEIVRHRSSTMSVVGGQPAAGAFGTVKAESLSKPPVSQAQRAAMGAAASGNSTLGIPKKVGKEFIDADKGGKLPETKKASEPMEKEHLGFDKLKNKLAHKPGISDPGAVAAKIGQEKYGKKGMEEKAAAAKSEPVAKAMGAPPMAKPPSGANMGTSVPTSKPAAPAAPKPAAAAPKPPMAAPGMTKNGEQYGMEQAEKKELAKIGMAEHGQREAAAMGFPGQAAAAPKPVKLPGKGAAPAPGTSSMHDQMGDAAAANKPAPAAAKPILPKPPAAGPAGKALGMASPKAAGVTRSAGPVQNAARPAAPSKPGIFGKLFGAK